MGRCQRNGVDRSVALGRIDDFALQGIGLKVIIGGILGLEVDILGRQLADSLDIGVNLKVDAALEFSTLSSQVLRVERDILETSRAGGNGDKARHPCGATQWTAARAYAADAASLLPSANLFHLYSYLEHVGQHLDQLSEVDTLIGDVIENCLVAIALILDVANLHLQSQIDGNLARADHRVLLASLGLLITFHVRRLSLAENTQYLSVFAQVDALHLILDQSAGQPYTSHIMTRIGLNGHPIATLEGDVGAVAVEAASRVLEQHLNNFKIVVGHILKPVGASEVTTADIAIATSPAARAGTALDASVGRRLRDVNLSYLILVHRGTRTLFCVTNGTGFTDDGDAHLAGISHLILDLLSNLVREFLGLGITDLVSAYDDAQFTASLDSISLNHAGIGQCQMLKVVEALDIGLNNLATGTRTSAADGIAHLHDGSIKACGLLLVVVGSDGIADVGLLLILLGQLHTQLSVWQFGLIVGHLADIVQQAGTASLLRIQSQLAGHDGAQVSGLTRVLQQVLAITGAIFHLTDESDQFRMQAMDTHIDGRALTSLNHLFLDLTANLCHHLLDAGGMDTAVAHQLMQCQASDLAAHRVKSRQHDSLGRVINHDLDACCSLQSTDITALTTDDATLNFVIINMEHRHSILDRSLGSDTLDGLDDDALGLFVGSHLGIIHDIVDVTCRIGLSLILERLDQFLLSLIGRQAAHVLKRVANALLHLVDILLALVKHCHLVLDIHLQALDLIAAALEFALLLVEGHLTLLQFGFAGLYLAQA